MQKSLSRLSSSQVEPADADLPATSPVVGLLWEGHQLIRDFVEVTDLLASSPLEAESPTQLRETAQMLHHYVTQSLPLHVHDEEKTLEPRLAGHDPKVDAALEIMRKQHSALDPGLSHFLTLMNRLAEDPSAHAAVVAELRPLAAELHNALISHIDAEERILWPAIVAAFDDETQSVMASEMRARRAPKPS